MRQSDSAGSIPEVRAGTMRRRGPGARLVVLYLAAILLVIWAIAVDERPTYSQFFRELYDLRHVVLLGFAGLLVLELTALLGRRWIRKRSLYYAVAAVFVVAIGLLIDNPLPASGGPQDEAEDALRNIIGGIAFLTLSGALDRPLRREHDWLRGRTRQILGWMSVLVLIVVFRSLIDVGLAYAGRNGRFPVLVDLTESWQQRFVVLENSLMFVGKPPGAWTSRAHRDTAMISFEGERDASITINEVYPDWAGFNTLRLQVYSDLKDPVILGLHIDDKRSDPPPGDRYDTQIVVQPGLNEYEIPYADIRAGPTSRELRLNRMRRIGLVAPARPDSFRLFFSGFRLVERDEPGN
jgi:hypothetical protein